MVSIPKSGKGQDKQMYVKSDISAVIDMYSSEAQRKESSYQPHRTGALELSLDKCTSFLQGHKNGMGCAKYGERLGKAGRHKACWCILTNYK